MPTACPGEDARVTAAPTGRTTAPARTGRTAPTTSTASCCGDREKCRLSRASTSRAARAMRPPGRFPPPPANPVDGFPPNGAPGNGGPVNGGPMNGGPMNGGPADGGPIPGRQYRLPNGRRVPPRADRPYRPQAPGPAGGMRGPWDQPGPGQAPGPPGQDPLGGWGRPPRPQAPSGPPPGAPPRAHPPGDRSAAPRLRQLPRAGVRACRVRGHGRVPGHRRVHQVLPRSPELPGSPAAPRARVPRAARAGGGWGRRHHAGFRAGPRAR